MELIASRDNAKIKYACKLSASAALREADGRFFAESPKLCLELAKTCRLRALYTTEAALDRWPALAALGKQADFAAAVTAPVAKKLAGTLADQGVFGVFETPPPALDTIINGAARVLALENVQDPGNVGTLLRSAAAFGFDGVLLGAGCASPFAPKTLRASMGAAGQLPTASVEDLPAALGKLRARGVTCLAAALYNSEPLQTVTGPFARGLCVVIGSEGQGLTGAAVAACDKAVRIPMTDKAESLNAGVAGSILLWHFRGA